MPQIDVSKLYDWKVIQLDYDLNKLTIFDLYKKYGIDHNHFVKARKERIFESRLRSVSRRIRGTDRTKPSKETKEKIRIGMLRAVQEGRHQSNNAFGKKCRKIWYTNWLSERVFLLGGWELKVAQYLDEQKIKWTRPKVGIKYTWNNSEHLYFPDFYLPEVDKYIEVKGYKTDRDIAKWKQFPFTLVIIDKHNINSLNTLVVL